MPACFNYNAFGAQSSGGGNGGNGNGNGGGNPPPGRDKDVIEAIAADLDATGQFAASLPHQAADRARAAADQNPVATVRYMGHSEDQVASGPTIIRKSRFEIVIAYRAEESDDRIPELDRLANVAVNAIDGHCLASITFPYMTEARSGAAEAPPGQPNGRIAITGTYAYLIDGFAARLTT